MILKASVLSIRHDYAGTHYILWLNKNLVLIPGALSFVAFQAFADFLPRGNQQAKETLSYNLLYECAACTVP